MQIFLTFGGYKKQNKYKICCTLKHTVILIHTLTARFLATHAIVINATQWPCMVTAANTAQQQQHTRPHRRPHTHSRQHSTGALNHNRHTTANKDWKSIYFGMIMVLYQCHPDSTMLQNMALASFSTSSRVRLREVAFPYVLLIIVQKIGNYVTACS